MDVQSNQVVDDSCHGACKHSKKMHQVRSSDEPNKGPGCCKVDCACMEYKPPPKK